MNVKHRIILATLFATTSVCLAQNKNSTLSICRLVANQKSVGIFLTNTRGEILKGPVDMGTHQINIDDKSETKIGSTYRIIIAPSRITADRYLDSSPEVRLSLEKPLCKNSHTYSIEYFYPPLTEPSEAIGKKHIKTIINIPTLADPDSPNGWANTSAASYKFSRFIEITLEFGR